MAHNVHSYNISNIIYGNIISRTNRDLLIFLVILKGALRLKEVVINNNN